MLSYLFSKLNKITEKQKGKIKQKKEKDLPGAQEREAHPAQPAHRGRGVFFPAPRTQAARWNATEPAGRPPRHLPAWSLPGVLIVPWRRTRVPRLHFPPPELSPLPLLFVSVAAKYHRGAHRRIH